MIKTVISIFIISLLAGCAHYTIHVISNPPGAKIEMDGEYMGDAPLDITVTGGAFSRRFLKWPVFIKAFPSESGQYLQSKCFGYESTIPAKIYFDMNLHNIAPKLEYKIDLHNR